MMNLLILSLTLFASSFSITSGTEYLTFYITCGYNGSDFLENTTRTTNCSTYICSSTWGWLLRNRQCSDIYGNCHSVNQIWRIDCVSYRCGPDYTREIIHEGCSDSFSGRCVSLNYQRTDSNCRIHKCTLSNNYYRLQFIDINSTCHMAHNTISDW